MKMITAIVNKEDSNAVSSALTKAGFSVTKLSTTGGFLMAGNVTCLLYTSENTRQVMALLRGFHQSMGQTIIMITHDRELALQAQRILTLADGRVVRDEVNR